MSNNISTIELVVSLIISVIGVIVISMIYPDYAYVGYSIVVGVLLVAVVSGIAFIARFSRS